MKHIKYFIICIVSFFIFFYLFHQDAYSTVINRRPHILILNSYHNGYEWSDSIVDEIMSIFKTKLPNTDISIEYMDTKKVSGEQYYEELYKIYNYKYSNQKIDVIISIDNNAFDFLLKYRDDLFSKTPVVFCGVNNFNENLLIGHDFFTGIAENPDIKANIDIALKLHPNTKKIAVITDKDTTSAALRNSFALAILAAKNKVNLTYIEDTDIDAVKDKVRKLPGNSIIFLMNPVFKDSLGGIIPETEASKAISDAAKLPVYSLWGYYMNNGIVGGMLTSGSTHGKQAADMAVKILSGTSISFIPIVNNKSSNKAVFDYNKLEYFGIKTSMLPKGSTIINEPPKSYTISKQILWITVFMAMLILIIAVINLSLTVAKLKRTDNALMESEERYHKLVDFLPDAIYVSHNGINVFSNAAGLKLAGLESYDELHGLKMMQFINSDSSNLEMEKMKNLFLNNNALPLHEYEILKKDGTKIYAEASSIAFPWEGDTALLIAARDITERKQAEELKEKLEENNKLLREAMEMDVLKTEFFANISHELKTPLNVVLSSAQMLDAINNGTIKFDNNSKADKYISMMKLNCFRLIRLVDNLIDSTKIDAGYYKLNPENLDIVSIVENITLSVVKCIEDRGINLIFDTEVEEKIISCDGEKIERIILNLLSNATKFTNEGGSIIVNIRDKTDSVIISVKDTGIGIPKEKQESIFERFVQVDKSLSRNRHGSGIGLSIVKSLVEMHGGSICLESEPGHGSEFIIELPAKVIQEDHTSSKGPDYLGQVNTDRIKIEFSDI